MSTTTAQKRAERLAQEPLRPAEPTYSLFRGTLANMRDIASRRELLGLLVNREFTAKYKDSALGFVWSLIRPLALLLIYYIALGKFMGAEKNIPSFAIFIYSGLTAWTLYSEIISIGTSSVVNNSGLVKKIYLPREVFPLSVVGSASINFAIQLAILVAATAVTGKFPTGSRWWYLPLSLALLYVFATAMALLLSATNVYLRDVQYLVEVALMILFWASPVVYSWQMAGNALAASRAGGRLLEELYLANPATLIVLGFQRVFWVAGSDRPFPADLGARLGTALAASLVILWISQRVFARMQGNFAQEL
ncbi:MAG: ABC transporter permease [Cellulomonas sp.]|uniref:ABC transporter permease n=1 Tax=Cellulomonas sp. 73-92 TaxID=1895740 RepID=UPI000927F169|nr:ABC transporter permease [Cellulomonas sp. 73-92]MBN9376554.1 ABC transporter permease [Cellulomonas sp.]OJV82135.1 MAG: sugar ABC transporter [Cellulomonas sp. 73-92]